MAILNISYWDLNQASRNAKKSAGEFEDYARNLERGVAKKLSTVSGGTKGESSVALNNINSKINELKSKANSLNSYSKKIDKLSENVTSTDRSVSKKISYLSKVFANNNGFKIGAVSTFIQYLIVKKINSSSLGRWAKTVYNKAKEKIIDWKNDLKHWYKTGGGKYIKDIVFSVVAIGIAIATVVSIVAGIIATGGIGLVAACTLIAAVLAIANGINNIITSAVSYKLNNEDPAWATRYGKLDKLSDTMRFLGHDKIAAGLDIVEAVTGIVAAFSSLSKLGKKATDFMGNKGFVSFRQLFGNSKNGSVGKLGSIFMENKESKWSFTFKSFTNGLKSLKIKSVRDSLGVSFKQMFTDFGNKFKYYKMNWNQSGSVMKNLFANDTYKKNQSISVMKNFINTDVKRVFNNASNTLGKQIIPELDFTSMKTSCKSIESVYKSIDKVVNNKLTLTPNLDSFKSNVGKIEKNYNKIVDNAKVIMKH